MDSWKSLAPFAITPNVVIELVEAEARTPGAGDSSKTIRKEPVEGPTQEPKNQKKQKHLGSVCSGRSRREKWKYLQIVMQT